MAVAHSLLTVIYHVLNDGTVYQDLGADYFDRLAPGRRIRYHLKRLAELGYAVTLAPVVVGQPSPPPTTTSETGGGNVDGRSGPDAVHPVRRAKRA